MALNHDINAWDFSTIKYPQESLFLPPGYNLHSAPITLPIDWLHGIAGRIPDMLYDLPAMFFHGWNMR